jgi:hypothetical protein
VRTDGSFASSRDPRVVFGLGLSAADLTFEIPSTGGRSRRYLDLPADRHITFFH